MRRVSLVLPLAAALAASGLLAAPALAGAANHRPVLRVSVAKNGRPEAPATVRPGIAHLQVSKTAAVGLVQPLHGIGSAAQVIRGFKADDPEVLLRHYRLVALTGPGAGEYARVRPGVLYIANLGQQSQTVADVTTARVTGAVRNAELPLSRRVVVGSDHALHMPGSLRHISWLHVENRSSVLAFLWTVRVDKKVTDAQVHQLLRHPSVERFFAVAGNDAGLFASLPIDVGPHGSVWTQYPRTAGRYVTARFPTRNGAHLLAGQVREVIVHGTGSAPTTTVERRAGVGTVSSHRPTFSIAAVPFVASRLLGRSVSR